MWNFIQKGINHPSQQLIINLLWRVNVGSPTQYTNPMKGPQKIMVNKCLDANNHLMRGCDTFVFSLKA